MTAASVTRFQPQYGEFLYATIGEGGAEMPLSVLSALARIGVDPWEEAAGLSELSLGAAKARLTSLLSRLPASNVGKEISIANIVCLLQLLPNRGNQAQTLPKLARQKSFALPIVAALLVFMITVISFLTTHHGDLEPPSVGSVSGSSTNR